MPSQMRTARPPHNLVVAGPDGSGKSDFMRSQQPPGHGNHTHEVEPAGGSEVWARLDEPAVRPGQWESTWRKVFLVMCLSQLNAHRQKLSPGNLQALDELVRYLHPQIFEHRSFKNIYTIASRFAYEPQPLRTFEAHRTWEDVELFLTRLPKRQQVPATQWIDNFDQYFDNQPQLLIKVQASLAHYLLRQEPATSLIHTSLSIRGATRDYWLRTTGHDLAESPAYHDVRDEKSSLVALFDQTIEMNTAGPVHGKRVLQDDVIYVPEREHEEHFVEYALRHTFLTRSSVRRMASSLAQARRSTGKVLSPEAVRRLINERAHENALMEVYQAASDLRALVQSNHEPPGQETTVSIVKDMLRDLGSEVFTWDAIQDRISRLPDSLVPYMMESLWRHRLLLISPEAQEKAYCSASSTDHLGSGAPRLRLHSSLLEYCGIFPERGRYQLEYL